DEVGGRALDRRVDRGPLGAAADRRVGRADVRLEMRLPPEQGLGETMLAHERQRSVDVGADAGEAFEIAIDDRLAFLPRYAEPAGEPPGGDAVEDREIDRLGLAARVAVDGSEQLLGGNVVDVLAGAE